MCNNVSLCGAAIALVSSLFVAAAFYSETALAEEAITPAPKLEQPAAKKADNFPWSAMIHRSTPAKRLNAHDQRAALQAIHFALREVADGSIFVWRRPKGNLNGRVKPTSSFRDAKGSICRHLEFTITHGKRTKQIESIACRKIDGSWTLSG